MSCAGWPFRLIGRSSSRLYGPLYSPEAGRRCRFVGMVGLLILNSSCLNLSDERVVEFWTLSGYGQLFAGEPAAMGCAVRGERCWCTSGIGSARDGAERILAASIAVHGAKALEKEVVVTRRRRRKAITFPTRYQTPGPRWCGWE